jgi:hypothetical protein
MYAKKGKDRFVLIFPTLGVVVKIPMIRILRALKAVFFKIRDRHWKGLARICSRWAPESLFAISAMLFKGIIANQREYVLWKRSHNPFLQPTFFSFFGLFNIQAYGKPYEGHEPDLWIQIRKITREEAYCNPHQFSEPHNYCIVNGKLRILDYGGGRSARIILRYGKKIVDEFDFGFHYTTSSANKAQS